MPNENQARLKAFSDQLVEQLYQIPTPVETQQFLTGDTATRIRIVQSCKQRAMPIVQMLAVLEAYKE